MIDSTRRSWNIATRNHNAHKGDQAAFLRGGGDLLFPEERALLGPLAGKSLVHLQCYSGQDSLCLARDGAGSTYPEGRHHRWHNVPACFSHA